MVARMLCALLTLCVGMGALHLPRAAAGMVTTEALFAADKRDELRTLLARDDLRARLKMLGVDPADLEGRVAALTPEEADELAARLDELPAGGDVLGAAIFVLLVLLVTDILGYTDVYPFITRTVNGDKRVVECVDPENRPAVRAMR